MAEQCTPGRILNRDLGVAENVVAFNRTPFTEKEVKQVCDKINVYISASLVNVKTMVIKHAFLNDITRITKLFNSSLLGSEFPSKWKLSTVVPLPKVTHPVSASDLRPVALTLIIDVC